MDESLGFKHNIEVRVERPPQPPQKLGFNDYLLVQEHGLSVFRKNLLLPVGWYETFQN